MENVNDYRFAIRDEDWERIKDMLPPEHPKEGKRGRPTKYDNRTILNGIVWMDRSGATWRDLPEIYGKWQAVYARFRLWKQNGVYEKVFALLTEDADMENISIDSTCIKVHESANGGKKI